MDIWYLMHGKEGYSIELVKEKALFRHVEDAALKLDELVRFNWSNPSGWTWGKARYKSLGDVLFDSFQYFGNLSAKGSRRVLNKKITIAEAAGIDPKFVEYVNSYSQYKDVE